MEHGAVNVSKVPFVTKVHCTHFDIKGENPTLCFRRTIDIRDRYGQARALGCVQYSAERGRQIYKAYLVRYSDCTGRSASLERKSFVVEFTAHRPCTPHRARTRGPLLATGLTQNGLQSAPQRRNHLFLLLTAATKLNVRREHIGDLKCQFFQWRYPLLRTRLPVN